MSDTLHASAVSWQGRALLIMGASGAGKSDLALALMALGCDLVGDDRLRLQVVDGRLEVTPVATIAGLIEARGIGILKADHVARARVVCVVDLDRTEQARLPQRRTITLMGCDLPLICRGETPHWQAALLQLLKAGWSER